MVKLGTRRDLPSCELTFFRRIPIIGKHTKKITAAAWNKDSILVLASEDKSLSINNSDGDTLRVITLRDVPCDLQFSEMKTDERASGENTVSRNRLFCKLSHFWTKICKGRYGYTDIQYGNVRC